MKSLIQLLIRLSDLLQMLFAFKKEKIASQKEQHEAEEAKKIKDKIDDIVDNGRMEDLLRL